MKKLLLKLWRIEMAIFAVLLASLIFGVSALAAGETEEAVNEKAETVVESIAAAEENVVATDSVVGAGVDKPFEAYGYQLALNGRFELRYYIGYVDKDPNVDSAKVEFKVGDSVQTVSGTMNSSGMVYYVCDVPPKYLIEIVSATLIYNGTRYELSSISVRDYLEKIIVNEGHNMEYNNAKDLALAILEYGSYVQKYFKYKTNDLAGDIYSACNVYRLEDQDMVLPKADDWGMSSNSDFEYLGYSLVLESDISMKIYFFNDNYLTLDQIKDKYTCRVSGVDTEVKVDLIGASIMTITISNIPIIDCDNFYTVKLMNKAKPSDSVLLDVGVNGYIEMVINKNDTSTELRNLCKALYLYNIAAEDYFKGNVISSEFEGAESIICDKRTVNVLCWQYEPVVFDNYVGELSFSSSNEKVATITGDEETGYYVEAMRSTGIGTSIITATDETGKSCRIYVNVYSWQFSNGEGCYYDGHGHYFGTVGDTAYIDAKLIGPCGEVESRWATGDDPALIGIDDSGNIVFKGAGNTTIYKICDELGINSGYYWVGIAEKGKIYVEESNYKVSVSGGHSVWIQLYVGEVKVSIEGDDCVEIYWDEDYLTGEPVLGICGKGITGTAIVTLTDEEGKTCSFTVEAVTEEEYESGFGDF